MNHGRYIEFFSGVLSSCSNLFIFSETWSELNYVKFAGLYVFYLIFFQWLTFSQHWAPFSLNGVFCRYIGCFCASSLYDNLWRPVVENYHQIIWDICNFSYLHRLELGAIFDKLIFTNPIIGYFCAIFYGIVVGSQDQKIFAIFEKFSYFLTRTLGAV